jgi:hypothetical protein
MKDVSFDLTVSSGGRRFFRVVQSFQEFLMSLLFIHNDCYARNVYDTGNVK